MEVTEPLGMRSLKTPKKATWKKLEVEFMKDKWFIYRSCFFFVGVHTPMRHLQPLHAMDQ